MRQYFCTYFDRNYLTRGLALVESLQNHCSDFVLYVVCMDEYTRLVLNKLAIPQIQTIPFHEVELRDRDLAASKKGRSVVEYIWTSTPAIILHVLNRHPEISSLVYVDADLYFFSNPSCIYGEMGNKSVLIHEHRFPTRHQSLAKHGRFNVGLLVFKNNAPAREVLRDWRLRCIEWCYERVEDGKFGDQAYLDSWPTRFPQVHITTNIGVGVAPWNHEQYRYSVGVNHEPCINDVPIVFYHYHSFKIVHPEVFILAPDAVWTIPQECVRLCFMPYIQAIRRAYKLVESKVGEFPFGYAPRPLSMGLHQVVLSSKGLTGELQKIGLTQPIQEFDADWAVFQGSQYVAASHRL